MCFTQSKLHSENNIGADQTAWMHYYSLGFLLMMNNFHALTQNQLGLVVTNFMFYEQQRHRSASVTKQSDQCLCYLVIGKCYILT